MEWRLVVSLLGIKMINDSCLSNHVHLFAPMWLKFLLWSTWGSYYCRLFILKPSTRPLESICSWMRAPLSLYAQWFAFCLLLAGVRSPVVVLHPCVWSYFLLPGGSWALGCVLRDCAGALAGLGETTQQEHSGCDSCSVPCLMLLTRPRAKGTEEQGLGSEPRPCTADPRGQLRQVLRGLSTQEYPCWWESRAVWRAQYPCTELSGHHGSSSWCLNQSQAHSAICSSLWGSTGLHLSKWNSQSTELKRTFAFSFEQQDLSPSASMFSSDPGNVTHLHLSHLGSELSWVWAVTASLLPGLLSAERMKNA